MGDHKSVEVTKLPLCDIDREHGEAYADGKTIYGPWAYMCKPCFDVTGVGLGLGRGQVLVIWATGRVCCEAEGHEPGDHTAECISPAEPDNPELRLLRALHGLCPDCDRKHPHTHPGLRSTTIPDFLGVHKSDLTEFDTPEQAREADWLDLEACPEDYTGWAGYLLSAALRHHYADWDGTNE